MWKVSPARTCAIHSILGLQQVWDIDTPKLKSGYLLPSQQLNLEDHATSDTHLLGLFLFGGFSPFGF